MKGKFINGFKFRWNRYKKKKGFFPALYIGLAAIILTVVFFVPQEENSTVKEDIAKDEFTGPGSMPYDDEEAKEVLQEEEMVQLPIDPTVKSEIVTKFFEVNAGEDDLEQSVTFYNNRYYESKGIHVKSKEEDTFDVVAAISGTVKEVKEDPLLGQIVILQHDSNVETYYASLAETTVKENDRVEQGDILGKAGKNTFSADSGIHVHFEIHKDGVEVNPEQFIDEPFQNIVEMTPDPVEQPEENEEVEEEEETNEMNETDEANEGNNEDVDSPDKEEDDLLSLA